MKKRYIIILFIVNFILDFSILSRFEIFGIIPSVTIPIIIVLSMFARKESIVYYAIFQGLIQDLAFSNTLGLSALLFYLISYYIFKLNKNNNYKLLYGYSAIAISLFFSKIYSMVTNYLFVERSVDINIMDFIQTYFVEFLFMIIAFTLLHYIALLLEKRRVRNLL